MSIFTFGDVQNNQLEAEGVVEAPSTTFTDVVSASYDDFLARRITGAKTFDMQKQEGQRFKAYKDLSDGSDLERDAVNKFLPGDDTVFSKSSKGGFSTLNRNSSKVKEAVDKYVAFLKEEDPNKYATLLSNQELEQKSISERKAKVEKFEEVSKGATSTTNLVGGLVGGIGASFLDPVNLLTLPFGAGVGAGLLKTMAVEAGVNVAAEAATIPSQIKASKELGFELTSKDIFLDLATAGAFGAGISGAIKGAGSGLKFLEARAVGQEKLISDAIEAGDFEMATAARRMQKEIHTDSYKLGETDIDPKIIKDDFAEIDTAIREMRPIDNAKLKLTDEQLLSLDPKSIKDPTTKQNLIEFQKLARETAPELKGKFNDIAVQRAPQIKDARVASQEAVLKSKNSDEFINQEIDTIKSLNQDARVFKDGELKGKEGYDVDSDTETVGQIANDYLEDRALSKAVKACGVG